MAQSRYRQRREFAINGSLEYRNSTLRPMLDNMGGGVVRPRANPGQPLKTEPAKNSFEILASQGRSL
jgi:hypothetical protein